MKIVKLYLWKFRLKIRALCAYVSDYFDHIKYCAFYHDTNSYTKDMYRCHIMLLNHQLEKAQTYGNTKNGYGKEKIKSLIGLLGCYIIKFGYDSVVYTSIGVMQAHFDNPFSFKEKELMHWFHDIYESVPEKDQLEKNRGGKLQINLSKLSSIHDLYDFMNSRRSCRMYENIDIEQSEIKEAIRYAMTAPSACNRQCVRAHYYRDVDIIKKIIFAQESDVNWCLNAKGLFVITAKKSAFRDYFERNQRFFDAGLFSMNLVLGLHNLGIGSCFKMAQKGIAIEKNTKAIAGIPEGEDISVLLLVGKYPHKEIIIAKSSRLDLDEIVTIH